MGESSQHQQNPFLLLGTPSALLGFEHHKHAPIGCRKIHTNHTHVRQTVIREESQHMWAHALESCPHFCLILQAQAGKAALSLAAPYAHHWRTLVQLRKQRSYSTVSHCGPVRHAAISQTHYPSSTAACYPSHSPRVCAQDGNSDSQAHASRMDSHSHVEATWYAKHEAHDRPRPVSGVRPVQRQHPSCGAATSSRAYSSNTAIVGQNRLPYPGLEPASDCTGQPTGSNMWLDHVPADRAWNRAGSGDAASDNVQKTARRHAGTPLDMAQDRVCDRAQAASTSRGHADAAVPSGPGAGHAAQHVVARKARPQVCVALYISRLDCTQ